jgi:hypothetical protein
MEELKVLFPKDTKEWLIRELINQEGWYFEFRIQQLEWELENTKAFGNGIFCKGKKMMVYMDDSCLKCRKFSEMGCKEL